MTGEEIVTKSEHRWAYQAKYGGEHSSCQWCSLIIGVFGYVAWCGGSRIRGNGEIPPVCASCPVVAVFGKVCTAIPEYLAWKPVKSRTYSNVPPYVKVVLSGHEASQAILELIQVHRAELVTATDEFLATYGKQGK